MRHKSANIIIKLLYVCISVAVAAAGVAGASTGAAAVRHAKRSTMKILITLMKFSLSWGTERKRQRQTNWGSQAIMLMSKCVGEHEGGPK